MSNRSRCYSGNYSPHRVRRICWNSMRNRYRCYSGNYSPHRVRHICWNSMSNRSRCYSGNYKPHKVRGYSWSNRSRCYSGKYKAHRERGICWNSMRNRSRFYSGNYSPHRVRGICWKSMSYNCRRYRESIRFHRKSMSSRSSSCNGSYRALWARVIWWIYKWESPSHRGPSLWNFNNGYRISRRSLSANWTNYGFNSNRNSSRNSPLGLLGRSRYKKWSGKGLWRRRRESVISSRLSA